MDDATIICTALLAVTFVLVIGSAFWYPLQVAAWTAFIAASLVATYGALKAM